MIAKLFTPTYHSSLRSTPCLLVAVLVSAASAALADNTAYAAKTNDLVKTFTNVARENPLPKDAVTRNVAATPVTTFVDGPTGFVFVHTSEGWKFVRSLKND
ncbi:MAG: hypothetical protein WCD07_02090 [Burkholderiales bacterium]